MQQHPTLSRYVTPPRLRSWTQDEWFLYFDPANFVWTRVNESGRYLIELLRKHRSVPQIAQRIEQDFGMPAADAVQAVNAFCENLVGVGFLHHDEYRERERSEYHNRPFPAHIYLHMTNECNLKCPYCYNRDDRDYKLKLQLEQKFAPTLSTAEYKHLISRLVEEGIRRIFFTGGEPLMRPDLIELAEHARSLSDTVGLELLTNGILIKGERVRPICELFDAVTISLDGHERHIHEHFRGRNTFAPTVAGVRRLVEMKEKLGMDRPYVAIVPALTDLNIGFMKEMFEFALDGLGANGLAPIIFQAGDHQELSLQQIPRLPVFQREADRTKEYLLERQANRARAREEAGLPPPARGAPEPMLPRQDCGVGHGEISVDPSGYVYPCQSLHFDEFRCGNVREADIQRIFLDSPVMQRVRGTKVQDLAVCRHCDLRELCNGGCRATAYNVYRDFEAHNEIYCRHLEKIAVGQMWMASDLTLEEAVEISCSPN
ncbi:MAG TPA: PqqD family peptide modification chaperone [Longimicrobiaceae bacterium]|jgi:radical SAM protein with 4Fe4S-binding SPASM domain|nr:PqqD family peptide modification chaperone [Longimicrobiaceae bacterium]